MIRIVKADGKSEREALGRLSNRDSGSDPAVEATVKKILKDVRLRGDDAVRAYGLKFDGFVPDRLEIDREDMKRAFERIPEKLRDALVTASGNIRKYHEKQIQRGYETKDEAGNVIGQIVRGLSSVGLYVPGGTAAYPSTVLMNAIPAKLAGVEELILVTPPSKQMTNTGDTAAAGSDPDARDNANDKDAGRIADYANPDILAAAFLAGVDRVMLTGGAQAVAALAYGTETIPKVDKIVGPGNIYVATAKRLVFGCVDIDMIAGPSEILIIADETANPAFIAADLLSQAEHDRQAASILLTTDEALATKVAKEIERQLAALDRQEIAAASIAANGLIVICRSEDEAVSIANDVAPEHLEIITDDPMALLTRIKNAGSVFLGSWSPEPLGDYYAGTNHVLPTSGTARFASPLGVYDFVKRMSYTMYTRDALEQAKDDIIEIGTAEGLTAHVASVKIRFEK
ncbi:MAG: histidinol dehydrogenase [Clostridiales Family XIII bacterium]|nr:histidinol dehydrogenase [Clostridiales Family XIII bacterium]